MPQEKRGALQRAWKIKDFAQAKGLSTRTVWRMVAAGQLKIERYSKRCVRVLDENNHELAA
jgi:hypothetical protein